MSTIKAYQNENRKSVKRYQRRQINGESIMAAAWHRGIGRRWQSRGNGVMAAAWHRSAGIKRCDAICWRYAPPCRCTCAADTPAAVTAAAAAANTVTSHLSRNALRARLRCCR
jgi:hypothetical protein